MLSMKMIPFSKYRSTQEATQKTDFSKKERNARVQAGETNKAGKVSVNILDRLKQYELTTQVLR